MAESSSSGKESSEEEEEDESASPSLRGATSPITATNRQTSRENSKRAIFSERGYLNSLSRQERRRIKREIRKGRKLALTVSNITSTLAGIGWRQIGFQILRLPGSKCDEISSQCSTDEERTAALVREWLLRDPLASWRRIIRELHVYPTSYKEHSLGDSIFHYAEELTDTSLTLSNVTKVLSSVATDDLWSSLNIPYCVSERIANDCGDDEEQRREQHIHYYITCSPHALIGWSHIAGILHFRGEETAERAAKDYVQRAPEPSLILENLNTVMESVSEGGLGGVVAWLHISYSKQQDLQQQYPVVAQLKRAYSAYFLTHHAAPCWWIIARALYEEKELGALEVVQKLYLRGTSESRRLFEISMKQGYVDAFVDKMAFYGSAGVGKTCTMSVVAGEDPPDVRTSTPIATRPITMIQMQESGGKWIKYKSKQRMWVCAHISKHILGKELLDILTEAKRRRSVHSRTRSKNVGGNRQETAPTITQTMPESAEVTEHHHDAPTMAQSESQLPTTSSSSQSLVDPEVLQVIHDVLDEMFELIDKCPETEDPITYIHKLLISDCGGQPQFHEVLPIFLKKMSMIVFVFKLSEDLSSRPMIEYYEEGKAIGTPYPSDHTTEQLIQQGLRSLHTHRSGKDKGDDAPKIVVLGTHEDLEHLSGESKETKNRKLRDMMLPTFKKEIVYYEPGTGQILFPMNAKTPGRKEEDMAQAIRCRFSRENRSDKKQLPLQWVALEIMLDEITQKLKRGILSRNECLEIARRLHLDESALDAALIYLDELSLVFYYSDILPGVVFTNPQVLLDKISELVKAHHDKIQKFSGDDWQSFFCHALVTVEFLAQAVFKKHYVSGLFEPDHLVLLYRKLLIFADFTEGKFFVPSLLRMLSNKEIADHRLSLDSLVAPIVLHFPDGPPRRGIFCALTSFLTSPENHSPGPWELMMPARSVTPTCLHRNCIQFEIPCVKTPCAVTLIDTLLQFEVHIEVDSALVAAKLCPAVKHAISTGLRKANIALGYTNSTPSFALLCPCGEGDPHPAAIGDGSWICSMNRRVGKEFTPNQLFWTIQDAPRIPEEHACQVVQSTGGSATNPSPVKPTAQMHNNGHSTEIAGNSAKAIASITSTVEYRTIVSCTTKLRAAVCNDLVRLSGCLLEKGLISQENESKLRNEFVEKAGRAAHLVDLIQQKVNLDSRNYIQFTSILEEDKHHYSNILRILREAYSSLTHVPSESESAVHVKIKHLPSFQVSHGVDSQPSPERGVSASEERLVYNSSMSEEDFCQWLRSRGISEKDCKALSENGVTPSGFDQLDAEDFDDIGLTKIGRKLILKILAKVVSAPP